MPGPLPLPGEQGKEIWTPYQGSRTWGTSWIMMRILIWIHLSWIYVGASDLYTSNGSHILRLTPDGGGTGEAEVHVLPIEDVHRPVGLAVDSHLGWLFWSDIAPGHQGIYRSRLDGSQQSRIVQDVTKVNGLAVDWLGHHVYWTDESRRTIELATYDGTNRHITLSTGLKWPRGIAIDPTNGWMYWSDQGTKSIGVARLDGSQQHTLVDTGLVWPNQVVLSIKHRRLYWVDAYNETVESCDLEGGDKRRELDLQQSPFANPVFGLAILDGSMYFSTWYGGSVYSAHIGGTTDSIKVEAQHLTEREMFSLSANDVTLQPIGDSPCKDSGPSHCSHLCLISSNGATRCVCPSYRALVLSRDGTTCIVPTELLLYADKDHSHIGVLTLPSSWDTLPTPNTTQHHILATSRQPVAVGYDPINKKIYWSDVEEECIYRVGLDGQEKEVFLNSSQGIGQVDGLYVDWHHHRLYFTNRGQSQPTPEGKTFLWHRVEFIGLDGRGRRTVVSDVDKPRAVVIDFQHNYMYYSDWGREPKVIRSDLDGLNPVTIVSPGNISNPNGLTLHGRHLYVADSNYNKRLATPFLGIYDVVSHQWSHMQNADVHIPYGLAVRGEGQVFFTDWMSTESSTGAVFFHSDKTTVVADNLGNPAGLFYSTTSVQQSGLGQDPCLVAPCSDLCINAPEIPNRHSREVRCLCAEGKGKVLHQSRHRCVEPEDFLLFTDLNTVRMIALEENDQHVYILHYGSPKSNFVALTFDPVSKVIYWSDLTSKSILHGSLDGSWSNTFLETDLAIDGMVLDRKGHHLYFTGYNSMTGIIAMVTLDEMVYTQILSDLDQPRAIALDLNNNHLFWTEYGVLRGKPSIKQASLDGKNVMELEAEGLKWPNALAVTDNQLYLADGATCRVDAFSLNGSYIGEIAQLSEQTSHIFGMAVEDDGSVAYLTDWHRNRTVVARLAAGRIHTLASHLYRPSGLVLHRHTWAAPTDEVCGKGKHLCSHVCVPSTEDYHCICPSGMKLASDQHTCIEDHFPWQPADDVRCHYACHSNAICGRLIPTMQFQCVCRQGYEGDGVHKCEECAIDHYKSSPGNFSCVECPPGAGSLGNHAATRCYCQELGLEFQQGQCMPSSSVLPTRISVSKSDLGTANFTEEGFDTDTTDLYEYPAPQFEGCPKESVVQLPLPLGQSEAELDLRLSAYNYLGHTVAIEGNHPVPPGTIFSWRGRGQDGYQHVLYTAKDLWGHRTSCDFSVYVVDTQPPRFLNCPENMLVNTTGHSMRVFWDVPEAVDNVGVAQLVAPSWDSGWEFRLGTWPIMYRAYDLQGNSAWCNFTVSVKKMYIKCEVQGHFTQPRHGGVACGPGDQGYICHTFCDSRNHYINPRREYHSVRCDPGGTWLERFPEDYHTRACLRKTPYRTVERQVKLWFTGPCDPDNKDLKAEIITAVINLMKENSLCPTPHDHQGPACHPDHFHAICGASLVEDRFKRSADHPSNTVRLDVKLEADASVLSNMSFVEELLNATSLRIKDHFSHGVTFRVRNATYHSLTDHTEMEPLQEKCQQGTFHVESICLLCPVGSYLPLGGSICHNCPQNSYQDEEGQMFCKTCPEGATAGPGAYNASQCRFATWSRPMLSARDVIIVSVAAAAVLITICLICMLCLRRRQQLEDKQEDFPLSFKENKNDEPYIMEVRTSDLDSDGQLNDQNVPESSKNLSSKEEDSMLDSKSQQSVAPPSDQSRNATIPEEIPLVHHRSPGKTKECIPEPEGDVQVYEVTIT